MCDRIGIEQMVAQQPAYVSFGRSFTGKRGSMIKNGCWGPILVGLSGRQGPHDHKSVCASIRKREKRVSPAPVSWEIAVLSNEKYCLRRLAS
jgi:hypothetical protein